MGYIAERVTATTASGGKPVAQRCEVLAAPDGSGPLFRWGYTLCYSLSSLEASIHQLSGRAAPLQLSRA